MTRQTFLLRSGLVLLGCCVAFLSRAADATAPLPDGLYAEIGTPRGTLTCELYFQKTPLTVASFVGLAEGTLGPAPRKPYFNGIKFHRVVADFVVQGGDPLGTGEGGPGYEFQDEVQPRLRHDGPGVLSMANDGPDTNGSQFFLTLRDVNRLNYLHTVFGRVVRGLDILTQIKQDDAMTLKIVRRGGAAQAFRADDAAFKTLLAQTKKYSGQPEPGATAHFDDPENILPSNPPRSRAFNFKLANIERATGVKIIARMQSKAPPAAEDAQPGAYMRALATKLGVAQRGALAVYFVEEGDWRVWIGDELASRFVGRPGTAKELTDSGAIHEAKEAFLKAAKAAGEAEFARQQRAAPPDRQPSPQQRIKVHTDTLLDGLIGKLEP